MAVFSSRRKLAVAVTSTVLTVLLLFAFLKPPFAPRLDIGLPDLAIGGHHSQEPEKPTVGDGPVEGQNPSKPSAQESESQGNEEKLAMVTYLSGTLNQEEDLDKDDYFIATRILVWQLLHNPSTRNQKKNVDVVVIVTPSVTESRRKRLERDGAIVHPVDFLHTPWIQGSDHDHRWDDIMVKLRIWQMTQYSRVLLLDGDVILREPIDGVFDDPGAQLRRTQHQHLTPLLKEHKFALPDTYLLGGIGETTNWEHPFPPTWENGLQKYGYFNAAFFVLAPSLALFDLYVAILKTPNSFDPTYMEQNLLNDIHKWEGPMPWKELAYDWIITQVNDGDLDGGVKSMHAKWWKDPDSKSIRARDLFRKARWQMQGWYDAWDLRESGPLAGGSGVSGP